MEPSRCCGEGPSDPFHMSRLSVCVLSEGFKVMDCQGGKSKREARRTRGLKTARGEHLSSFTSPCYSARSFSQKNLRASSLTTGNRLSFRFFLPGNPSLIYQTVKIMGEAPPHGHHLGAARERSLSRVAPDMSTLCMPSARGAFSCRV